MPLLTITTSIKVHDKDLFLKNCSHLVSQLTEKSEEYVMVRLFDQTPMYFDKDQSSSCFIDLKSIGSLNFSEVSNEISSFISKQIGISSNNVYIHFENISPSNWAWNGKTFG